MNAHQLDQQQRNLMAYRCVTANYNMMLEVLRCLNINDQSSLTLVDRHSNHSVMKHPARLRAPISFSLHTSAERIALNTPQSMRYNYHLMKDGRMTKSFVYNMASGEMSVRRANIFNTVPPINRPSTLTLEEVISAAKRGHAGAWRVRITVWELTEDVGTDHPLSRALANADVKDAITHIGKLHFAEWREGGHEKPPPINVFNLYNALRGQSVNVDFFSLAVLDSPTLRLFPLRVWTRTLSAANLERVMAFAKEQAHGSIIKAIIWGDKTDWCQVLNGLLSELGAELARGHYLHANVLLQGPARFIHRNDVTDFLWLRRWRRGDEPESTIDPIGELVGENVEEDSVEEMDLPKKVPYNIYVVSAGGHKTEVWIYDNNAGEHSSVRIITVQ